MSKTSAFRQIDVTRAVRGVVAAGKSIKSVEIDQAGRIVVITEGGEDKHSPLDEWRAKHGADLD